jgi:PAS domain S-box-containing protein
MANAKLPEGAGLAAMEGLPRGPAQNGWQRFAWVLRYGLAIVLVAAAMGLRLALTAWVGPGLPTYVTFYPAVMAAGLVAGFGPGMVATALVALAAAYWLLPPDGFAISSPVDRLGLAVFIGMGLFMSTVAEFYRRHRHKAAAYDREVALRASQEQLRTTLESIGDGFFACDADWRFVYVNAAAEQILGIRREDVLGKIHWEVFPLMLGTNLEREYRRAAAGEARDFENLYEPWGRWFHNRCFPREGGGMSVYFEDITARKSREEKLQKLNRTLTALSRSSQAMMRATAEPAYLAEVCRIVVEDCGHAMVWVGYAENDDAKTVRSVASAGFEAGYIETLKITWADTERGRGPTGTAVRTGRICTCRIMLTDPLFAPWREEALKRGYASSIVMPLMAEGRAFGALTIYSREPDPFTEDEVKLLAELADDTAHGIMSLRLLDERARTEEALRESEERYRSLFDNMLDGYAYCRMIYENGSPTDFVYIGVNEAFERMTGLKDVVGKRVTQVIPGIARSDLELLKTYARVAETGQPERFETYLDALKIWFLVSVYSPRKGHFVAVFDNITERKRADEELRRAAEDLARSNKDLEQFAYIASHDLQAPLRQVTAFMKLLRERYGGTLDARADEYINFAVDGAAQMTALITDLLAYSRAGNKDAKLQEVNLREPLDRAITALGGAIAESGARVDIGDLPAVQAHSGQLTQLFQNLVGNAVKFRRDGVPPQIDVGARRHGSYWLLWVKDNGIGLDPAQSSRAFELFRRLHGDSKYPGTGIGLAICKKIVERYGGRIWVESSPGEGSTFWFTLPAAPVA